MAAILCILGPLSIPIGPVPISLGTLAIFLITYIAGMKRAFIACCLYILLGFIGLPVFAGFTGGAAKLLGPTGGYIIGYLPLILCTGFFTDRFSEKKVSAHLFCLLGMTLGTVVLYALGTIWLAKMLDDTFVSALHYGVFPFLLTDGLKMLIAMLLGPVLHERLPYHFR